MALDERIADKIKSYLMSFIKFFKILFPKIEKGTKSKDWIPYVLAKQMVSNPLPPKN